MKKIFTLVAAALMVAGLNAQELGAVDAAAAGIVEGGSALTPGTVLAQSANVTMTVGADDTWKTNNGEANGMKNAIVGEVTLPLAGGAQGSTNPKDIDGGNCDANATAPATGAFVTLEVKKNGYLYVFHKGSSNKTYLVGEEGTLIGYQFAMHTTEQEWGTVLSYTLAGEGEYNYIVKDSEAAKNLIWPEKLALGVEKWTEITDALVAAGASKAQIGVSGAAVIKFPVFEGLKYTVNACGSKIMISGFIFSETDIQTVKLSGDEGEVVLMGTTALENVAASVVSSRYYLLSGEEVAAPQAGNTGLYIVKNIMSDGSVNVSKVVLK
ncbi:MAG: hypothetical protein IIX13_08285 [Bacteroidales bacterium]|nr:hypothetical protein [Bacteroidales bacterium]